jgi:hypothetical protein
MSKIKSVEAREKRFSRSLANSIFLQHSLNDRLHAEIVHTVASEQIVRELLAKEFSSTSEATFQSEVLNHVYGEVLNHFGP